MRAAARALRSRDAQMTVELAVVAPVVIAVALVILNLMGFVEACAAFDQAARDAVLTQGVSPAGEQGAAAVDEVRAAIADLVGMEVRSEGVSWGDGGTFAVSPLLTRYVCTLMYRPWPRLLRLPGVTYEAPLALTHECELVVDRHRPGVVI